MTRLIADMSMSIDGYIATPDDDITPLVGWFFSGDTEVAPGAPFKTSSASAELLREAMASVGAIIGGRRYFDLAQGWGGRHPMGVPVFILTHEAPADWPADSTIHFVTDGLQSAVAQARAAAGDKDVAVATPGTVRQTLAAGVLNELQVNVVPVVLGRGLPFFDGFEQRIALDDPDVIEGTGVTHLRYRIAAEGRAVEAGVADSVKEVTQAGR